VGDVGGAIQLAGEVKARGERWRVRSDWMAVEHECGVSVSSAVMSFEQEGLAFKPLGHAGPPGFQRGHLPHPDHGRQRGDAARRRPPMAPRGIEEQIRKLFEVCRLRDVPIITFCREGRPQGPRPVRPVGRDRAVAGARRGSVSASHRLFL
jgi:peptide chain release factor 3